MGSDSACAIKIFAHGMRVADRQVDPKLLGWALLPKADWDMFCPWDLSHNPLHHHTSPRVIIPYL